MANSHPTQARMGAETSDFRTAPVRSVVAQKGRDIESSENLLTEYDRLSRTIRLTNRAQKGPAAGRPFIGAFNGEIFPDGADADDASTWLQPGESMDVPKDVALHLCGNLWDPKLPDKGRIIMRYGDFRYAGSEHGVSGRMAPMTIVGPPAVPDLVAVEVNGRGKAVGEPVSMWDLYRLDQVGERVPARA